MFPEAKPITFVTGKGGVGKSLLAAGIALKRSLQSKKTLLLEIGDSSYYTKLFGIQKIDENPYKINDFLYLSKWSPDYCLKNYLVHLIKIEALYNTFFENKLTQALLNGAPALHELAILGKITSQLRRVGPKMDYDCIVIDSYSTGQTLALLKTPGSISEIIKYGPIGEQSAKIAEVLTNSKLSDYFVVTLPEEMPTQEALELHEALNKDLGLTPQFIVNKIILSHEKSIGEQFSENEISGSPFLKFVTETCERQNKNVGRLKERAATHVVQMVYDKASMALVENIEKQLSVGPIS